MTVTSGVRCLPGMARVWSGKTADKAALIDGERVVTYAQLNGNLFLVDRLKDMIVSGGENIYSAEVERALMSHPSVESAAVVGAPDEKWGERVVAFVVTYPDKPVDVSGMVSHCRDLIAGYKVPKEIHLMDTLLRLEAMWGYALCGGNTAVMERSQQFFDKVDHGRAGATAIHSPCDRAAAKDMTELFPLTGPRKLVHGERESFIGGYGWQRSGPSVGSPGPDVGGGST